MTCYELAHLVLHMSYNWDKCLGPIATAALAWEGGAPGFKRRSPTSQVRVLTTQPLSVSGDDPTTTSSIL